MNTCKVKIKLRSGTSENWANNNQILDVGELGIELDSCRIKAGNGTDAWQDLKYIDDYSLSQINEKFEDVTTNIFNIIYPVGSIYLSTSSVNPSVLFGGTWEQIKDRFLLSAGDTYSAGATGGSATHKLTAAQMPSVTGKISFHGKYTGNMVSGASGAFSAASTISGKYATGTSTGSSANSVEVIEFDNGGQGKAHNNMPPYLAVYVWKRVE